jgi:hypothetical protein
MPQQSQPHGGSGGLIGCGIAAWTALLIGCSAPSPDAVHPPGALPDEPEMIGGAGQSAPGLDDPATADPMPSAGSAAPPAVPGGSTGTLAPVDPDTLNATDTWGVCRLVAPNWRAGIGGSDLGFTIPAPPAGVGSDRLTLLFGDTWAQATEACWFAPETSDDLQATLPMARPSALAPGAPSDGASQACEDLQVTIDDPEDPTTWRPIRLFTDAGERADDKQLDMTFLRTPVTGFSDGAHTYGVFLRNEPVTCSDGSGCPTGTRCSTDLGFFGTALGTCRGSRDIPDTAPAFCLRPSVCASDGTACLQADPGVCLAENPFTLQTPAGAFSPPWYAQDPRRALVYNVYIASASWPDRPEDYAVGHRFATNRFINSVARTVSYFDPEDPSRNDYRHGTHTLLLWGRPWFFAEGGAQAPLYLLYQPLAGLRGDDGAITWSPRFFAGYDAAGKPRWSANEAEAQPVYGTGVTMVDGVPALDPRDAEFDLVNHAAISWVETLQRWVMFYGGSVPDWMRADQATQRTPELVHLQPVPNAIHMRSAAHPWGRATSGSPEDEAWTAPEPVLTREAADFLHCDQPGANSSIGCTVPRTTGELIWEIVRWARQVAPDEWRTVRNVCLVGNLVLSYLYQLEGSDTAHLYGTNIIDSWTEDVTARTAGLAPDERSVELYWNVSTWNPYQVVLMKTQLRARVAGP